MRITFAYFLKQGRQKFTNGIAIEGEIAPGEKIKLKSTLDPKRTFKLKVKSFEPKSRLVWGDSKGNSVYTLTNNSDGTVLFAMEENSWRADVPDVCQIYPVF